ncbi:MAG: type II toxin-antitoxin system RelE/ParE family toxin [Chlorobi bacterium]|nr:type II toxin-antitoxin system RelE/ParE family toxin [Chlorobiota bacterium]
MNDKSKHRKIVFYKNYFSDFFVKQEENVKSKIVWIFQLIEELQRVPETFLKHVESTEGLYEIRVRTGKNIYRIFCFFDEGRIIVIINSFQKKTKKTPRKEIKLAMKIKKEYFNEKEKFKNS